jgi:hypothetical protein
MEPSEKVPEIADFLENLCGRTTAIKSNHCVNPPIGCGKPIQLPFTNPITRREYEISGLCPDCQASIFSNPFDNSGGEA